MRRVNGENRRRTTAGTKCAVFLLGTLGVLGLASQASATRLGSYLALKGGIYSPSASFQLRNAVINNDTFKADTKAGFDGEIAIGHFFLPTFALELGTGYFKGKGSFPTAPVHDIDFNVVPVMVSAKALIPVGPVDPYGEVGIGVYFTKVKVTDNRDTFSFDGTRTFGLHAGAGLNINVSPNAFVGVEGRYVTANPSFGDQKIDLNNSRYALNGFKLNGFTTTAVLGFSF
jgi:opacity protein-like surface antigen